MWAGNACQPVSHAQNIRGTVTASVPAESNHSGEKPAGNNAFPHDARLLRHADFESVYKQGRRHFSPAMTVFYLQRQANLAGSKAPAAQGLRIGFTVGRALGGAVQRNRMKRRLREAVRLSKPWPAANVDVVINPKKTVLTLGFDAVLNELRRAFVVIEKKLAVKETELPERRKPEAGSRS
jgi:ribonuclease P protein component